MSAEKDAVQDFSKPTKWELQARAEEQKEAAIREVAPKLFNPTELTKSVQLIHEAERPLLGKIRYGELTLDDSFTIAECKTDADKTSMAAYLMLKKAYPEMPNYTPENIGEWRKTIPLAEGAALFLFIRGAPAFLRAQSVSGYATTGKRKK